MRTSEALSPDLVSSFLSREFADAFLLPSQTATPASCIKALSEVYQRPSADSLTQEYVSLSRQHDTLSKELALLAPVEQMQRLLKRHLSDNREVAWRQLLSFFSTALDIQPGSHQLLASVADEKLAHAFQDFDPSSLFLALTLFRQLAIEKPQHYNYADWYSVLSSSPGHVFPKSFLHSSSFTRKTFSTRRRVTLKARRVFLSLLSISLTCCPGSTLCILLYGSI